MNTNRPQKRLSCVTLSILLVLTLLVGCSGGGAAVPSSDAVGEAVSLDQSDLEAVLLESSDLPSNLGKEIVSNELPTTSFFNELDTFPEPDVVVSLDTEDQDVDSDNIPDLPNVLAILLYSNLDDMDKAYNTIVPFEAFKGESESYMDMYLEPIDIGEKGRHFFTDYQVLVFTRCNALIIIQEYWDDIFDAEDYAERLDKRLEPLVCR